MKKTYFTTLLFALFLLSSKTQAYNIRQISNKDGLSNSAILSINQDAEGVMWFGSCDGLNMFDGIDVQVYKPTNDNNNLSGNLIEKIIETEPGIFWIYTNYGLNRLNKRKMTVDHYNDFKGKYHICKSMDNDLFIVKSNKEVCYYNRQTKLFDNIHINDLEFDRLLSIAVDDNNTFWLIDCEGYMKSYSIVKTKDQNIELRPLQLTAHSSPLLYCFIEESTAYLIDETYTLYEYDLKEKQKYYIYNLRNEIIKYGEISSVVKNKNDLFIGFKTNGLLQLINKPDQQQQYTIQETDIKVGIFCLEKDKRQNIVWIGTDGQGIYMYSDDPYSFKSTTFDNLPYTIEKPVRALHLDSENTLWIGTKGDGIVKISDYNLNNIKNSEIRHFSIENSLLNNNSVYAFAKSNRNILWIGSDEGLNYYSYKDKAIKRISSGNENIKYVHSICEINDSTLWVATVGTGVIKVKIGGDRDNPVLYDPKKIKIHNGQFDHNFFFTTFREDNTTLWFGNRGYGAYKFDTTNDKYDQLLFDKGQNQTLNDIFSIEKDQKGNYWFGSSYGLIKHTPDNENTVFNDKNGFPNNTVHGILTDSQGNLWLSTNQGIIKFNPKQETFRIHNHSNGLLITEFSDGAYFKDEKTGNMFFGGINGFVTITESNADQQEYMPPVIFSNLAIFGKEHNINDFLSGESEQPMLKLDYSQNFFSVSFAAINYINGNNYSFLYKLEGMSNNWIDNGTHTATFTDVRPGYYTLQVKYKDRVSGKESTVYSLPIRISPPWYMSPVAYIIYGLLFICAIYLFIKYLLARNNKKKHEEMERMEQKHTKEVYESKLRFFTNIAHEFCTPLTLIYGPCNRLLSYKGSDENVKKYTSLIQRNAERLNNLIQDLIDFRRIETGHKKPQIETLSVTDISYDISGSFNEMAESKNILFEKNIEKDLLWNSDRGFLIIIITNLLSNALKYTWENGEIKLSVAEKDNYLTIVVSNTGKGIKEENLESIFDRYSILDDFENKDDKTGAARNGLGLAISHSMVKLLNGTIEVKSTLNEWTDFIVRIPDAEISIINNKNINTLPEINIHKEYDSIVEIPRYEFDKSKPTILIIDDDKEILWFISECFADEFNVLPVNNPVETKELLEEIHPDIIICDILMPGIDGISLTKKIKGNKKTTHIPMILISAKHDVEEQIGALEAGAEMYITKPFNVDHLKTSVKLQLSRKEALKDYFNSPLSAFDLAGGKLTHKENKRFIQDIYDIINKNITNKDLSTQFIASELNISTRHLYRKLAEIGEQSPSDIIKESRLYIAKNLLLNTKMTIDEIIYKSGFSNRGTFFRAFADKYNCTPKDYREQHIGEL